MAQVKAQALFCPNCGGQIQLRGFAHTLTAVCQQCLSVLDASTPTLHILQTIQEQQRRTPKIPLGMRGKFGGVEYQAIGFQTRATDSGGVTYEWDEYVLFNPFRGFLYLSEYQGHWNVMRGLRALPEIKHAKRPDATYGGITYRHFQHYAAETIFVLGEFPWRVRAGEDVVLDDYTAPPHMLSAERTGKEVTWSAGEYATGEQIWQTFGLKDQPPRTVGPYLNQPNPDASRPAEAWRLFKIFFLILLGLAVAISMSLQRAKVLDETHHFVPGQPGEQSFVTSEFDLKGHESNVVVETKSNLDNNWIYLNYALINQETGKAFDFGREISYYNSGGETEGSKNDRVTIPGVPSGRYYLRVEPEGDANNRTDIEYDIIIHRGVPSILYYVLAAILLLLPPIATAWRSHHFEYARWQESDYATKVSSGGDD